MRIFHCDHCDNLVFFENTHCIQCGHLLAFLPDLMEIGSLDPDGEDTWRSPHPAAQSSNAGPSNKHRVRNGIVECSVDSEKTGAFG